MLTPCFSLSNFSIFSLIFVILITVCAYNIKNYEQASSVSLEGLNFVSERASHRFICEVEAECESLLFDLPEIGRRFKVVPPSMPKSL